MGNRRGGLIFGVIMGTILGVLFAPRKGKEMRKKLKEEVEGGGLGAETLKQSFLEMGKEVRAAAEKICEQPAVKKQVNKGRKKLYEFIDRAEKKLTGLQSAANGPAGFVKKPIKPLVKNAGRSKVKDRKIRIKQK